MGLGNRFLITALVFGTCGMLLGLFMGVTHDFLLAPVHAHLNLLGFVGLFIAGLYYRATPEAEARPVARWHYWLAATGVVLMTGGLSAALLGYTAFGPLVLVGALLLIATMVMFIIVVSSAGKPQALPAQTQTAAHTVPAE